MSALPSVGSRYEFFGLVGQELSNRVIFTVRALSWSGLVCFDVEVWTGVTERSVSASSAPLADFLCMIDKRALRPYVPGRQLIMIEVEGRVSRTADCAVESRVMDSMP